MEHEPPVPVPVTCTACERTATVTVPSVYLDPLACSADPPWDGVFLVRVVKCEGCGAVDQYRVAPHDAEGLRRRASNGSKRVLYRRVDVLGKTLIRRPSEALDQIRAEIEAHPGDGLLWARLGNAWNMLGDLDAAADAWRRAVDLDKGEFRAALSLAVLAARRDDPQAATEGLLTALSRIGGLRPAGPGTQSPEELAEFVLDLLESYSDEQPEATLMVAWAPPGARASSAPVVTMSGIHLASLERWDRLGEFLSSGLPITAVLHSDSPDETSVLQHFLESDRRLDELFVVRHVPGPARWVSTSKKRRRAAKR